MSAPLRILSVAAFFIADATLITAIKAANIVVEPSPSVRVLPRWGGRHYRWAARGMFVAGVRGATPLTVPFFGSNWYPGPDYYRPPAGLCICGSEDAMISVRY
jgi:hypothetical protein